jgi:trimeric autotransporter adhesin
MKNRILMAILPVLACFALAPQAPAACQDACLPGFNTVQGDDAFNLLGAGQANTGVGWRALFSVGDGNFNTALGAGALVLNTASLNTATGAAAGLLNQDAVNNTAHGAGALEFNLSGDNNTAVGALALLNNTTGSNTAVGSMTLEDDVSGFTNTAVGVFAGQHTTASFNTAVGGFAFRANVGGARNTAVGAGALEDITGGNDNTAIGELAGVNYTGTESNNVCIGSGTQGTAGESNAIRIGTASTSGGIVLANPSALANAISIGGSMSTGGIQMITLLGFSSVSIGDNFNPAPGASSAFIGGIYGQTFGPADMAVRIGNDNKLGTVVSSRRFKHDIKPMDNSSEAILALKPVTFQYNSDTTNTPRVGLIAEDVAEVSRALVVADKEGKPLSVRYEDINILLLNEFLKEHKKVEQQQASISQLKSEMQTMVAQLKEQNAQIQKVSAQLEASKPAPQIVANQP